MTTDAAHDALAAELIALGRGVPDPGNSRRLSVAVMARISDERTPQPPSAASRWAGRAVDDLARYRRRAALVLIAALLALLATPPVRAEVADWFGFAGVRVHVEPTPGRSTAPPPPSVGAATTLEEATRLVSFNPAVPAVLGPPDGVSVSPDRRLLSMSWTRDDDGLVRLDQFAAGLDYTFAKTVPGVEFTTVRGDFAMWFDEPHDVVVLDADGTRRTESARVAGHTLIWQHGETALRLEGDFSRSRAIEIATSVTPVP